MTMRTFAIAAALALVPATAFAASRSVEVKYDDLDLSTPQGMAQLDKRVEKAAKTVCTEHRITTGSIRSTNVDQACYEQTRQKMKEQVAALAAHQQQG